MKHYQPVQSEDVTFAPQQVGVMTLDMVRQRQAEGNQGVTTHLDHIDAVLNPARRTELTAVIGNTSNGKTALMNWIARNHAKKIKEDGDASRRCVVSVSWEQTTEEQGILDIAQLSGVSISGMLRGELGEKDWTAMTKAALERGGIPWWIIGHSAQGSGRRPRLTLQDVYNACAWIMDVQGYTIDALFLDYLQRIRSESGGERRIQQMDIVDDTKDLAVQLKVPTFLGAQAKREVLERQWKLPQATDGQETSNLEQSSDRVLSVLMPKHYYQLNSTLEYNGKGYLVTRNLLLVGVMKQKFGDAPVVFPVSIDPARNILTALEDVDLNEAAGFGPNKKAR